MIVRQRREKGRLSLPPSYLDSGYCEDTRIRFYMYSGGLSKDGDLRKIRGWELEALLGPIIFRSQKRGLKTLRHFV